MPATDTLSDKAIKSAVRPAVASGKKSDPRRRGHAEGTTPAQQVKAENAARAAKVEVHRLAAEGRPGVESFEHTARDWHAYMSPSWSSTHAAKVLAILESRVAGGWAMNERDQLGVVAFARRAALDLDSPTGYALAYAALGWHVFPLEPNSKKPLGRLVPHRMLDATLDRAVTRNAWGDR